MIIDFSIQNFGSVKDKQILSFEANTSKDLEDYHVVTKAGFRLLKMAIIYGPNASGKTTILQALNFLRELVLDPLEKKSDPLNYHPFEFDAESRLQNSELAINFVEKEIRYHYSVEFNRKAIVKEELFKYPNKQKIYTRSTDLDGQFTSIIFGDKVKNKNKTVNDVLTANTLWNNTVFGGFLKTNLEFPELKEVQGWFSTYLRRIVLPNTDLDGYILSLIEKKEVYKNDLVKILRKADLRISDILTNEEEKDIPDGLLEFLEKQVKESKSKEQVLRLKEKGKITAVNLQLEHSVNDKKYVLPIDQESAGTNRFFGLGGVLALLIKNSVLFPVDELEASLHPDLFFYFILCFLINSKGSQLLFTTHNRELLNNKDVFRNDSIWFTDRDENSATELYSLANFGTKIVRDTSNVYNAYKIGKLGAVPNLSDYYIDFADEKDQ